MSDAATWMAMAESVLNNNHIGRLEKKIKFLSYLTNFIENGGQKDHFVVELATAKYGFNPDDISVLPTVVPVVVAAPPTLAQRPVSIRTKYEQVSGSTLPLTSFGMAIESSLRPLDSYGRGNIHSRKTFRELNALIGQVRRELKANIVNALPYPDLRKIDGIAGSIPYLNNSIDFRVPVYENFLHMYLVSNDCGSWVELINKRCQEGGNNDFFVLGSSGIPSNDFHIHHLRVCTIGCGKTSLLWAAAKMKYSIYMRCITESIDLEKPTCGGFISKLWHTPQFLTTDQVEQLFLKELMCRLLVFDYVISHCESVNPFSWLLFSLDSTRDSMFEVSYNLLDDVLLTSDIVAEFYEKLVADIGYFPVIMLDDVQQLCKHDANNVELIKTIRDTLYSLPFHSTILWAASRIEVFRSPNLQNTRSTIIVSDFHCLKEQDISILLRSLPNSMMESLTYKLQGRVQFLADYLRHLINAVIEKRSDIFAVALMGVKIDSMALLLKQIDYFKGLEMLNDSDLMLLLYQSLYDVKPMEHGQHTVPLSYARYNPEKCESCLSFEYNLNEPLVVDAIAFFLASHSKSTKLSLDVRKYFSLGIPFEFIIALAVITLQKALLNEIGLEHLNHRTIVRLENDAQLLEYLEKFLENPEDDSFSLSVGTKITDLIVLAPNKFGGRVIFATQDSEGHSMLVSIATGNAASASTEVVFDNATRVSELFLTLYRQKIKILPELNITVHFHIYSDSGRATREIVLFKKSLGQFLDKHVLLASQKKHPKVKVVEKEKERWRL